MTRSRPSYIGRDASITQQSAESEGRYATRDLESSLYTDTMITEEQSQLIPSSECVVHQPLRTVQLTEALRRDERHGDSGSAKSVDAAGTMETVGQRSQPDA